MATFEAYLIVRDDDNMTLTVRGGTNKYYTIGTDPTHYTISGDYTVTVVPHNAGDSLKVYGDAVTRFNFTGYITDVYFESINAELTSFNDTFSNQKYLTSVLTSSNSITSHITGFYSTFKGCESLPMVMSMDFSGAILAHEMFKGCRHLKSFDASLYTAELTGVAGMFEGCSSLRYIDNLDVSRCSLIYNVFDGCSSLKCIGYPLDFSNSSQYTIYTTFKDCFALDAPAATGSGVRYNEYAKDGIYTGTVPCQSEALVFNMILETSAPITGNIMQARYATMEYTVDGGASISLPASPSGLTYINIPEQGVIKFTGTHTSVLRILNDSTGIIDSIHIREVEPDEFGINPDGGTYPIYFSDLVGVESILIDAKVYNIPTPSVDMFGGNPALKELRFNAHTFTSLEKFFRGLVYPSLESVYIYNTLDVLNWSEAFMGSTAITYEVLGDTDLSVGNNMSSVFDGSGLDKIPDSFPFKVATNLNKAFAGSDITQAVHCIAPNVADSSSIFEGCALLDKVGTVNIPASLNMSSMFKDCTSLTCISSVDTTSATDKSSMFDNTTALQTPTSVEIADLIDANGSVYKGGCGKFISIYTATSSAVKKIYSKWHKMEYTIDGGAPISLPDDYDSSTTAPLEITAIGSLEFTGTLVTSFTLSGLGAKDITEVVLLEAEELVYGINYDTGNKETAPSAYGFSSLISYKSYAYIPNISKPTAVGPFNGCVVLETVEFNADGVSDLSNFMRDTVSPITSITINNSGGVKDWTWAFIDSYYSPSNPVKVSTITSALVDGIDFSGGEIFLSTFQATNITHIPPTFPDTKAIDIVGTFAATELTEIGDISFTNAINADGVFGHCSSLHKTGTILTYYATLNHVFNNCTALTCIGGLNTTKALTKGTDIFTNTPALLHPNSIEQADLIDVDGAVYSYICNRIKIGTEDITNPYIGTEPVNKVMLGDVLVWERVVDSSIINK